MTPRARPATLDDLKKLLAALHKERADYLLIGAYALLAHGYPRATVDIDLIVPARDLAPEWFEEGEGIRLADEIVVDLVFRTCGETFETLRPFEITIDRDGVSATCRTGESSNRRCKRGGADLVEHRLVNVAPLPALARLDRANHRVAGRVEMRGGVLVLRAVAAPDVAARKAHAQLHPALAHPQALLAAFAVRRHVHNPIAMRTGRHLRGRRS
jgi:hypothetical protein